MTNYSFINPYIIYRKTIINDQIKIIEDCCMKYTKDNKIKKFQWKYRVLYYIEPLIGYTGTHDIVSI